MSTRGAASISFFAVLISLLGMALYLNYVSFEEAYGGGPPYYGRTTNMDKWQDPVPDLVLSDGVVIVACAGLFLGRRLWRRRAAARRADGPGQA